MIYTSRIEKREHWEAGRHPLVEIRITWCQKCVSESQVHDANVKLFTTRRRVGKQWATLNFVVDENMLNWFMGNKSTLANRLAKEIQESDRS